LTQATYVEAFGALAEGSVVLLDKVPANLVLGDLCGRGLLCGLGSGLLGGCEVRGASCVTVLVALRRVVAVDVGRFGRSHLDVV
jgi:hypothetical protein